MGLSVDSLMDTDNDIKPITNWIESKHEVFIILVFTDIM